MPDAENPHPRRRSVVDRWPVWLRAPWQLIAHTIADCLRHRVTGLAAEAAFFAILSLPPLVFGLVGAIGFVADVFDVQTVSEARDELLELAARVLTETSVKQVIAPTLDQVLANGRLSIISIGFVIAVWSGSRAMNVFVSTIAIMYGQGDRRSFVVTRALSLWLYVVFLIIAAVLLPLVLAGPDLVGRLLPHAVSFLGQLYWPLVLLLSACFLAGLYHLSSPVRAPWRADLPGGVLALAIWVGGSVLLRVFLSRSTASSTVYGPLAAPIAVLLWLYLVSLAVLIGAAFNGAVNKVFPHLLASAKRRVLVQRTYRRRRWRALRGRLHRWIG